MRFSPLLLISLSLSVASAAPPNYDASTVSPAAAPLYSWLSTSLSQWIPSTTKVGTVKAVDVASTYAASLKDGVNPFNQPDYKDYSIWQVIQENEYLTDLKKVLKYAGPKSKELLDDKSKKLTFLGKLIWPIFGPALN